MSEPREQRIAELEQKLERNARRTGRRPRAGRGRQPRAHRVPLEREPRGPHADERRDRHDHAAARHRPRPPPARVRERHPLERRCAAGRDQRPARLLEDRGRPARARAHRDGPARARRGSRDHARGAGGGQGSRAGRGRRAGPPRSRAGRSRPHPPGAHQPGLERHQVHDQGRGRDPRRARTGPGRGPRALLGARHRHRPRAGGVAAPVPALHAGRRLDRAPVRRHRPRALDRQAARRTDERRRGRAQPRRQRLDLLVQRAAAGLRATEGRRARAVRARRGPARAGRGRQRHQPPRDRRTAARRGLRSGGRLLRHRGPERAAARGRGRHAVPGGAHGPSHAGHRRARVRAARARDGTDRGSAARALQLDRRQVEPPGAARARLRGPSHQADAARRAARDHGARAVARGARVHAAAARHRHARRDRRGFAPPRAHGAAGRGQPDQPARRAAFHRARGLRRGARERRRPGAGDPEGPARGPRADGPADAGDGRAGGDATHPRGRDGRPAPADRGAHGERDERAGGHLQGGRHGRRAGEAD